MIKKESNNNLRIKRHEKIRQKIKGTADIPRLNVYRSNKGIYAQIIDDKLGVTLASSSNLELNIKNGGNIEAAKQVGKDIAMKCKKLKINKVVFDRSGYKYHGRVSALAEAAREEGLEF